MEILGHNEFDSLLRFNEWPAISIYMPISKIGDQQDPLRYKNFLTQLEAQLIAGGMRTPEARSLLEPEYQLGKDAEYWKHLGTEGLVVFLSKENTFRYPLPEPVKEMAVVGPRFHIRPLLPLLESGQYLVLALSRNNIQLFQGNRYRLKKIDLPAGTPKSIDEALRYDDPERQLQYHTKTTSITGKRRAMFHGHGVGTDDQKENLERYFYIIDDAIFPQLENEKIPIVLAGTEELHPVFRRITKSHTILPMGISENVDELSADILRDKAWDIAGDYFSEEEQEAKLNFLDNLGGARVAKDLQSILTATFDGRVETLFVTEHERIFGIFDPDKRQVVIKKQDDEQAVDLLDEAVFWTLNKKGSVYIKKQHDMPIDTTICGLLRY